MQRRFAYKSNFLHKSLYEILAQRNSGGGELLVEIIPKDQIFIQNKTLKSDKPLLDAK